MLFEQIEKTPLFKTKEFTNVFCEALDNMLVNVNKNYK